MNNFTCPRNLPANPSVSVLMSVYNAEQFVRDAIDSILSQTFADFEFLIINDGSTDRSLDIISSYKDPRIRLINNEHNLGLTRSLNRGLSLARGEYIARQDADDMSYPQRLQKQVAYMEANPDVVLLGTRGKLMGEWGLRIKSMLVEKKALTQPGILWQMMTFSAFIHSSVMFRKSVVWQEMHGYNEACLKRQDYELWSRIVKRHKVANLKDSLVLLRVHSNSISSNYNEQDLQTYLYLINLNVRNCLEISSLSQESAEMIAWLNDRCTPLQNVAYQRLPALLTAMCEEFLRTRIMPQQQPCAELLWNFALDFVRMSKELTFIDRKLAILTYFNAFRFSITTALKCLPELVYWMFMVSSRARVL